MDICDGLNAAHFWREGSSDSDFNFEYSANSQGNSSTENSPLWGFEKEPKVLIEKFDIEPFLMHLKSKSAKNKSLNVTNKKLPQLVASCFVKVVRDDLEQLKKEVIENSRLNKIKTNGILSMPFLRCKICEKAYGSEKKLQNHLENKHMLVYEAGFVRKPQKRVSFSDHVIVHELKEYHRCRKCTKIFEEYKSLKTHMKQEHRKRKCYICYYCSKNFVDRMFFKIHIKLHCDVCGLLLPNKRKYLMHRRESCRVIKKYTCRTCRNLFFSYMDLKDHSYDHLEDLFICDICKSQHNSKCAIAHHILYLHSKKRPKELYSNRNLGNERLFLCNFCEMSSLDKDEIDYHLSVLPDLNNRKRTGYKDYYFCDQCLRKFDTESNMLQHKWSHFLNTSENSQVQSDRKIQQKRIFKMNEKLPNLMQPKIVLERINVNPSNGIDIVDNNNVNIEEDKNYRGKKNVIKDDIVKKVATNSKKAVLAVKNGIINLESQDALAINKGFVDMASEVEVSPTFNENITDSTSHDEVGSTDEEEITNLSNHEEISVIVKKAIVDPKSKKTLISRFQCEKCQKYYSNNYCLNRHMISMHQDYVNLQCHACEESFAWPSLLKSHKCIHPRIPEMPFQDDEPEIQFDNYRTFGHAGIDELMNISENEDYMNAIDFEIPAPVVELNEFENGVVNPIGNRNSGSYGMPVHSSYKLVVQEVPIEF